MDAILPLHPAYPELFVLAMVCVVLLVDLFLPEDRRWVTYALTMATLAGAFLLTLLGLGSEEVEYTFLGMFVYDLLAHVLKLLVYLTVGAILVYGRGYLRDRGLYRGEFFTLSLFATLGMMIMISAANLLILYLGLELLSLSLYALVALQRDSTRATEAAMKYFILGALASGLLLYGMSMLYGATGTLSLQEISEAVASGEAHSVLMLFGLVFVVAGLGFKLGAVPFHMWVPDVYQGAPTPITLFIGSASKLAAFAFTMRLLVQGLGADYLAAQWQWMLVLMAVASLVIGNVTAIAQTNLKRMLAYSTISHMGFLLLGVLAADAGGYTAALFYVITYVLTTLVAFGMILVLAGRGFEAENLDDFKGLNRRSPWYAFLMLIAMFSMAGVPPAVGFYAKLTVLQAVVEIGFVWLAVVAVLCSLIGAFYYLRVVKLMYFDDPVDTAPVVPPLDARLLLSVNGLAVLIFGILPQPLLLLCQLAILWSL
ncbi:MAG: NADH-quinone oxidoreductase subunit NuoN [Burkholderiales bacterium]